MTAARRTASAGVWLLAAAAWLLAPVHSAGPSGAPLGVVLVDRSESEVLLGRPRPGVLAAAVRSAGEAGAVLVLGFADGVERLAGPGPPEDVVRELGDRLPPRSVPGAATALADALGDVADRLEDRRPARARVVVVSDGAYTGRDPLPSLARLEASGARVRWIAPGAARGVDLGIDELVLRERLAAGAPVAARVGVVAREGGPRGAVGFEVVLELDGEERARVPGSLDGAGGRWAASVDLGPAPEGLFAVRARLESGAGDPVAANDARAATARGGDARVVGVLAPGELHDAVRAWWPPGAAPGLRRVVGDPALDPSLGDLDALVTIDVGPSELDRAALEAFLRAGGGWLAAGGRRWLEAWTAGVGAAPLLALEPDVPDGGRDVVLVVDASGSMAGEGGAARGELAALAARLAGAARAGDRVVLRLFTDRLGPPVELREPGGAGGPAELAAAVVAARRPRGPTNVRASLAPLLEAVDPDRPTFVLLLSDGRDQDPADAALLAGRFAAASAELVVFAVGEPDLAWLGALAGSEPVRRSAEEALDAARRDLAADVLRTGALAVRAVGADGGGTEAELARSLAASGPPALAGFVRARRVRGTTLAAGPAGEPVVATQTVGAGRTVAWASAPFEGLGPRWELGVLAPLIRALAREGGTSARWGPGAEGALHLEGLGPGAPATVLVRYERPAPPAGWGGGPAWSELEAARFHLAPLADRGHRGPAPTALAPGLRAVVLDPARPGGPPLAVLPAPETGEPELALPARRLPQALRPAPAGEAAPPVPGRGSHPAGPWVLALGLALLAMGAFRGWERPRVSRPQAPSGSAR